MSATTPLRILHVIANINRQMGGPSQSVSHLAIETAQAGHQVSLASIDYPEYGPMTDTPGVEGITFKPHILTRLLGAHHPEFQREILQRSPSLDFIHNHGIWLWPNHYAVQASRKQGKILVTSARGMLGSWALGQRQLLKKTVWHLREHRDLLSTTAFHATSAEEAADIRALGLQQPIAIIPNGVDIPTLLDRNPSSPKRRAIFLSRLHPKKGLQELIQAWASLPEKLQQTWQLKIAGTGPEAYRNLLQKSIQEHGLSSSTELCGEVSGLQKQQMLEEAEILILPSYEENFGIVIAEALAHGTPVLTTQATPWKTLEQQGCGWCIPVGAEALSQHLPNILSLDSATLQERGARGRIWMRNDYSWTSISQQMITFYYWLQHGGKAPSYVDVISP
ncbi:MAG: glycosyltransferase [Blastochloris sp.]|nr:glycosyltransferase [Blastochloris sp.]